MIDGLNFQTFSPWGTKFFIFRFLQLQSRICKICTSTFSNLRGWTRNFMWPYTYQQIILYFKKVLSTIHKYCWSFNYARFFRVLKGCSRNWNSVEKYSMVIAANLIFICCVFKKKMNKRKTSHPYKFTNLQISTQIVNKSI